MIKIQIAKRSNSAKIMRPYIKIGVLLPRNPRFSIKNLFLDFEKEYSDSTFVIEELEVFIEDHVLHPHAIKIESDFS